jgi:serine/threonine-protein kinase
MRIPPRWRFFSLAVLGLLAGSLWLRAASPNRGQPAPVATRPNSMAILPFINASPDTTDDYLGHGIAAELTRLLDRFPGLRVAARSSAFGARQTTGDPRIAGRRLSVGTVLQGSVRRSGDRLRVTARLLDVEEGFDLWSETYEREAADLFAIQDEIGRAVANTLRLPGADSSVPSRRSTPTLAAYDAYLAGRYHLEQTSPGSVSRAIAHLSRAIRLDSSFARAHAALADAYMRRGGVEALSPLVAVPLAKGAVARALELDSTLAEAHTILGTIRFVFDRQWREAEIEFRRALALAPASAEAYPPYSRLLLALGRIDESREASERAVQLSPLSPQLARHLGWHYLHARQYDRAREELDRALALDRSTWQAHMDLALLELAIGNFPAAEVHLRIPVRAAPHRAEVQAALGQLYALSGRAEEAKSILQELQTAAKEQHISPYFIATVESSLGRRPQAFAALEQAVKERSEQIAYLRIDPRVDSLRTDRRFSRLLRRLRLP